MAEECFDIKELLQNIGLWEQFPEKIKRADLFSIRHDSVGLKPLYKQFLERLLHYDGTCRYLKENNGKYVQVLGFKERQRLNKLKVKTSTNLHPLDLSTAVFLCCDHIARQDLLLHFWGCKLAFPLSIKTEQLEPPVFYSWPMKAIIWNEGSEISLTDCKLKTVSAFRFGDQSVSKSNVLNILMSKSEKVHSTFFHRNCEGSSQNMSSLCLGMIEAMPASDCDSGHMLLLNLRGNCNISPDQSNFLLQSSVVVIVVCRTEEIDLIETLLNTNKDAITCETIIIVLTDLELDDWDAKVRMKLNELSETINVNIDIIVYKDTARSDFRAEMLQHITTTKGYYTLQDLENCARENHFNIDLDSVRHPSEYSDSFSETVIQQYEGNSYSSLFPLQGDDCVKWSEADLDIYKLRNRTPSVPIRQYRQSLEKSKVELRASQLKVIRHGHIQITSKFTEYLTNEHFDTEIFLRYSKLKFDNVTRVDLQALYRQYESLINNRQLQGMNANEIDQQLDDLERQINTHSLSISSFFREMGQIYETLSTTDIEDSEHRMINTLCNAAVKLLLHGYSIELMDGRSNYVPINWIHKVLLALKTELENVRIKVITVLGIQSSGKSTLLNIMFGSQFPVSSGRCTRGVHMHLVKVSEATKDEYLVDYFVIIDTEGLFSTETVWGNLKERDQKDRELATFVIGVSHITILNIMGEDLTYLKNILPVSVHAFLRMNLVGLNPKCRILHHNVDRSKRDIILRHKTRNLEIELDKQTRAACKIENVKQRRFTDIIRFDIKQDTNYFPPLFENINRFEIVNTYYGKAAIDLKDQLLRDTKATGTLEELIDNVKYLWSAIKTDNFVYEFRNTIEIEARTCMDRVISNLHWLSGQEWQKLEVDFHMRVSACNHLGDLNRIEIDYEIETSSLVKEQKKRNKIEFSAKVHNKLLSEFIAQKEQQSFKTLRDITKQFKMRSDSKFGRDIKCRRTEISIKEGDKITLKKLEEFIHAHLTSCRTIQQFSAIDIENLFLTWCREMRADNTQREYFDYENDAYDCIYSYFVLHRSYIDKSLQEKSISERCMDLFLRDSSPSYWSSQNVNQKEENFAKEVAGDVQIFMKFKVKEIKEMNAFYTKDIFTDLILEVKNHRHFSEGTLSTKESFAIDLTLSLCGALISKLSVIEKNTLIMSSRLKEYTEYAFKSRVHNILKDYKSESFTDTLKDISTILCKSLGKAVIEQLGKTFAEKMRHECPLLKTKQGLLYLAFFQMLENDDILPVYLNNPEMAIENSVSRKFDGTFGHDNFEMQDYLLSVIEENVLSEISFVCHKLSDINFTYANSNDDEGIMAALRPFVPVAELSWLLQHCEFIGHKNVIDYLIHYLQEETVFKKELLDFVADIYKRGQYKKIKHETIQLIMENFIGCKERCPFCGELCSNIQEDHDGRHIPLMHRPTGFKESYSKWLSTTCWEEIESISKEKNPDYETFTAWAFPIDVSVEENGFWKHLFAKYVDQKAVQLGLEESKDIPESWKMLTKAHVVNKLKSMAESVTEM